MTPYEAMRDAQRTLDAQHRMHGPLDTFRTHHESVMAKGGYRTRHDDGSTTLNEGLTTAMSADLAAYETAGREWDAARNAFVSEQQEQRCQS